MTTLKPLQRPLALGDQVYQTLRGHLRDGTIVAGQPLQEVQLAERLGVSRTPVREALTRLASEGLVASDGRSFVVPALTLQDVEDIYEVRCLLEPAALRRVAEVTTDPSRRLPIEEALGDAEAAYKARDADAFRDANIRFRNAWKGLVPNSRMVKAIEQYADHMLRIRALTLGDARVRTIVIKGLRRIVAALVAGDGEAAAAATRDHLAEAKRCFIAATGLDRPECGSEESGQ
ncbi:MAG TPA: GntR family transcriptional regulator [Candidatus Desulfobacillus sp.]|nr:GntR family transcriptional regulator [Candidatus Desulfobacillus sp.]